MDNQNTKSSRVLELYDAFISGKAINKHETAMFYNVNERSVQRDIDTVRAFLAEQIHKDGTVRTIEYDRKNDRYIMVSQQPDFLTKGELLSICKILISSRAYTKNNLKSLIDRLLMLNVSEKDKREIETFISNELFHYAEPVHTPFNPDFLWKIVLAVQTGHKLIISYKRLKDRKTVSRLVEPVGILFSEYYFYLMAVISDPEEKEHFDNRNDPFPTIYRLDRIVKLTRSDETFKVGYSSRFKEGEYKNKIQFMYGGEVMHITFRYTGPSVEAVLDRLPLSNVTQAEDGSFKVSAEVFGSGIKMWLLSQGQNVQLISPDKLVEELSGEISAMNEMYT